MKNMMRVSIVGLLVMAVSFAIGWAIMGDDALNCRFWLVMAPVMFGELLLAASFGGLLGRGQAKSFPMKVAMNILPWFYFAFALIMVAAYSSELSNSAVMAWQAAGLVLFLIPAVLCAMAGDAIAVHAEAARQANAKRTNFRLMLGRIAETAKSKFPDSPDLPALLGKCEDAVRYAADSPPGAEAADGEVEIILAAATEAARAGDEPSLKRNLENLLPALRSREAEIKTLR